MDFTHYLARVASDLKAGNAKTGKAVVSKSNYLAAPSTPDLLEDATAGQPVKPLAPESEPQKSQNRQSTSI